MGVIADLKDLISDLLSLGSKVPREGRQDIRDAVGELADELERAINLAIAYVVKAKAIRDKPKLVDHLRNARPELLRECKEYDICKGLYGLEDRFRRTFDPVRHTVEIGELNSIISLISDLRVGERSVIDDLHDMIRSLEGFADNIERSMPHELPGMLERLEVNLDHEQQSLEQKRQDVKRMLRRVIDEM